MWPTVTSSVDAVTGFAGLWNCNANHRLKSDSNDGNGNTIASGGLSYAYDFVLRKRRLDHR